MIDDKDKIKKDQLEDDSEYDGEEIDIDDEKLLLDDEDDDDSQYTYSVVTKKDGSVRVIKTKIGSDEELKREPKPGDEDYFPIEEWDTTTKAEKYYDKVEIVQAKLEKREAKLAKKQHKINKVLFFTVAANAIVFGALGPSVYFMLMPKTEGDRHVDVLAPDSAIVQSVNALNIETYNETEAIDNATISMYEYDKMVVDTANWVSFTKTNEAEIKKKLNLKTFEIPTALPDGSPIPSNIRYWYKVEAAPSSYTTKAEKVRKKYLVKFKAKQGTTEFEKENKFEVYSSDLFDPSIESGEQSAINLRNWVDNFNAQLQAGYRLTNATLEERVKNDYTEVDDNGQKRAFELLGFTGTSVDNALKAFPYESTGVGNPVKVKLLYKFQPADELNVEGNPAFYRLSIKAKYPTAGGGIVEVDNELVDGLPNSGRAVSGSSDAIPHTPTNQAKLEVVVNKMASMLTVPPAPLIRELEKNLVSDWVTITDSKKLADIGFGVAGVNKFMGTLNPDIEISYKFERSLYLVGESARYAFELRGRVVSRQLQFVNRDIFLTSSDAVISMPTTQSELELFMATLNNNLLPVETKTINHLDANITNSYTEIIFDSTFSTLGFEGGSFDGKAPDISVWYKFERTTSMPGMKAQYLLTLRGLTRVEPGKVPLEYTIATKRISSSDTMGVPASPTSQAGLNSYVNSIQNPLLATTDKTIEYLDSKVKNTWTHFVSSSALEQLGFNNANMGNRPLDVTVEYKFVREVYEVGSKALYRLILRGTTLGLNGTPKLEFIAQNKTIASQNVLASSGVITSEQGLSNFLGNIAAVSPNNMKFFQLDKMIQNTNAPFDRLVFESYNFSAIYIPIIPGDVTLDYKFISMTKVEGQNVEYKFTIIATTAEGIVRSRDFTVFSSDSYFIPSDAASLQDYANGLTMVVPTNKTIDDMNYLLTTTLLMFEDAAINALGITNIREAVARKDDVVIQYSFLQTKDVDKQRAEYTLTLYIGSTDTSLSPVQKAFKFVSVDVVDKPSTQKELDDYLKGITYTLPELTIEVLNGVITDPTQTYEFNAEAFILLGFADFNLGTPELDMSFTYTFLPRTVVDGQPVIYELTIFARTLTLRSERKILVTSTDNLDESTTATELEDYLEAITGTAPQWKVGQWNALIREDKQSFDRSVFEDRLGFTNVIFPPKESDVNLTYVITRGTLVNNQKVNYTITIYGRTTKNIERSVDIVVTSANNYTLPVTQSQLNTIVNGLDLTGVDKTHSELNALLGTGIALTQEVVDAFGLNIDLNLIPEDVILTYTLSKSGASTPNTKQTYTLIVTGSSGILAAARKQVTIQSSNILVNDEASVDNNVAEFMKAFGDYYYEDTITALPTVGETNAPLLTTKPFVPTEGVVVTYRVEQSSWYTSKIRVTFKKNLITQTRLFTVEYLRVKETAQSAEASALVADIIARLSALGNDNVFSSLSYAALITKSSSNKDRYTIDLGIDPIRDLDKMNSVNFIFTHNPDFTVTIRAEIFYSPSADIQINQVVTFILKASDYTVNYANKVINDSMQKFIELGDEHVSSQTWANLQNIASASMADYATKLGLPVFSEVDKLTSASFSATTVVGRPFAKTIKVIFNKTGTSMTIVERTYTFVILASDYVVLTARAKVQDVKNYFNSLNGTSSTRYWAGLKDVNTATQSNYADLFGIGRHESIGHVNSIAFTATNIEGDYTKVITAVITMPDANMSDAERTVVFRITSFDKLVQEADDKILEALKLLSTISYLSTKQWADLRMVTSATKDNFETTLGLSLSQEQINAIRILERATFTLTTSPHTYQRSLTIVLTESSSTFSLSKRTIYKELIASDKATLDQNEVDTKVTAAVADLNEWKNNMPTSSKLWDQLSSITSANRNNYTTIFGLPSKNSFYNVSGINFTSVANPSDYTLTITAVVILEGTTHDLSYRTITFILQARDKRTRDADQKVNDVKADFASLGTDVTSSLNWVAFQNVSLANKSNFASLLGMNDFASFQAVDNLRFILSNNSATGKRYTKNVTVYIEMSYTTLNADQLKITFSLIASDKAVLDAADVNDDINNKIQQANDILVSQTNKTSSKNWNDLSNAMTTGITIDNMAEKLGIHIDQSLIDDLHEVDSITFNLTEHATKYILVISYTITLSTQSLNGEIQIIAPDKQVRNANDSINAAKNYITSLMTNNTIKSTLVWEYLELASYIDKTTYISGLGIPQNGALDDIQTMYAFATNATDNPYTKEVTMIFEANGNDLPTNDKILLFNVDALDKTELTIQSANIVVDNAKLDMESMDQMYSSKAWATLQYSTTFNKFNIGETLGFSNKAHIADVDGINFTVTKNQDFSLTIDAVIFSSHSDYNDSLKRYSFVVYASDRSTMIANEKITNVIKALETAPRVSTKMWFGDLINVTTADKETYSRLGIGVVSGMSELTSADFTLTTIPNRNYSKRVTVVLYVDGTNIVQSLRTYSWNLDARDKAALDSDTTATTADEKVRNVFENVNLLSLQTSSKSWDEIKAATLITKDNFGTKLGLTITEELAKAFAEVDNVVFTTSESEEISHALKIKVQVFQEGSSFDANNNYIYITIYATDKGRLDSDDMAAEALKYFQDTFPSNTANVSSLTWANLSFNASADKTNFASRLGIKTTPILEKFYSLNFNMSRSATSYTVTVSVDGFAILDVTSGLEMGYFNYTFDLQAVDKLTLDVEEANNKVIKAKEKLYSFNFSTSTRVWNDIKNLTSLNKDSYQSMGVPYSLEFSELDEVNFVLTHSATTSYALDVVATIRYDKSTIVGDALVVRFTILAKNKPTIDANDKVQAAKAELDEHFTSATTSDPLVVIDSELTWVRFSNILVTDKQNFISLLGLTTLGIDMSKINPLTSLTVTLVNKPQATYTKLVKVTLGMTGTTFIGNDLVYNFELVAADKAERDANMRANIVIGAVKGLEGASQFLWSDTSAVTSLEYAGLRDNGQGEMLPYDVNEHNFSTAFGVLDSAIIKGESVSFEVLQRAPMYTSTYTILVKATVTIHWGVGNPVIVKTAEIEIYSRDKKMRDANDLIDSLKGEVLSMPKISSKNWSEIRNVTFAEKRNFRNLLGMEAAPARLELLDLIWIYADVYDPFDGTDGIQGKEYRMKITMILVDEDSTFDEAYRTLVFDFDAFNKPTLDANDRVMLSYGAIANNISRQTVTGPKDGNRGELVKWADVKDLASNALTTANIYEKLGIQNQYWDDSLLAAENSPATGQKGVTFTLTKVFATNDYTNLTSTEKYKLKIKAVVFVTGTDIPEAQRTKEWIMEASDKEYNDVYDFVLSEKARVAALPVMTTNFTKDYQGTTYSRGDLVASNLVIADANSHTGFVAASTYGTQRDNQTSTWAVKSRDSANGSAVITTTIVSSHPNANKFTFPTTTQDITINGFLTQSSAFNAVWNSTGYNVNSWQTSSKTKSTITAERTLGGILGTNASDARKNLIAHYTANNNVTVTISAPTAGTYTPGELSYPISLAAPGISTSNGNLRVYSSDRLTLRMNATKAKYFDVLQNMGSNWGGDSQYWEVMNSRNDFTRNDYNHNSWQIVTRWGNGNWPDGRIQIINNFAYGYGGQLLTNVPVIQDVVNTGRAWYDSEIQVYVIWAQYGSNTQYRWARFAVYHTRDGSWTETTHDRFRVWAT